MILPSISESNAAAFAKSMLGRRCVRLARQWGTFSMRQFKHPTNSWKGFGFSQMNCLTQYLLYATCCVRYCFLYANGSFSSIRTTSDACLRTCTLLLLTMALGGFWSLEQPSGSLLEFYPTWRFILQSAVNCGGPFAVLSLTMHAHMKYICMQLNCIYQQKLQNLEMLCAYVTSGIGL